MRSILASVFFLSLLIAPLGPSADAAGPEQPQQASRAGDAKQRLSIQKGTWWGAVGDRVEVVVKDQLSTRTITGVVTRLDGAKGTLTVEGEIDGKKSARPMLASNILSIKTLQAASGGAASPSKPGPVPAAPAAAAKPSGKVDSQGFPLDAEGKYRVAPQKGAFILPLSGMVGKTLRGYEIDQMRKEVDKWGPGQTVILDIDSGGGLVLEIYEIVDAIKRLKENHRVVAWIRRAFSAAACTSMQCEEIYFRTTGANGASTMITEGEGGYVTVRGEDLERFKNDLSRIVRDNGYSPFIFRAMVLKEDVLTYTKDPETGEVTWHDRITNAPGEKVLSDDSENLAFTADSALDSKFSKGTADSEEELAKFLGLESWYLIDDCGQRIAGNWKRKYESCEEDMRYQTGLLQNLQQGATDPLEALARQIQCYEKILSWHKQCPRCFEFSTNSLGEGDRRAKELEEQLTEMKKQYAAARKRQ